MGEFLAGADQVWRARKDVAHAVYLMKIARQENKADAHTWQRRQDAFAELRPGSAKVTHNLGLLRILQPELAETAASLQAASNRMFQADNFTEMGQREAERKAALEAFESAARKALTHRDAPGQLESWRRAKIGAKAQS